MSDSDQNKLIAMYDPDGSVSSDLKLRYADWQFASFHESIGGKSIDPIYHADSLEAAVAAKRAFLDRAKGVVVVMRHGDLRALEFFISALRRLIENKIDVLFCLTKEELNWIFSLISESERIRSERLVEENRLILAHEVSDDRLKRQLSGESVLN